MNKDDDMEQEFVTLPREVVEQAIEALFCTDSEEGSTAYKNELKAVKKLRAALNQPQIQSGVIPPNWKLAPVEPNCSMVLAGDRSLEQHDFLRLDSAYRAMLAAAPQPPTTEDCSVVQPQANQPAMTPIAQRKLEDLMASGYTISGYSIYHEQKHQHGFVTGAGLVGWWKPEGMEYSQPLGEQEPVGEAWSMPATDGFTMACFRASDVPVGTKLYTYPQPKRAPMTDKQISRLWSDAHNDTTDRMAFQVLARAIEAAHNIK